MMPDLRSILERRANTWEQMQGLLSAADNESRELTGDEQQSFDRLDSSIRSDSEQIERLQRAADLDAQFSATDGGPPAPEQHADEPDADAYSDAFGSYCRRGVNGISAEHRQVLQGGFVSGDALRQQGVSTDAAGGFLVPEGFRSRLMETLKFYGGTRGVVGNIVTATGNDLPWPTNDDTGNVGAYLAENTQMQEQDVTFGQRKLAAHTLSSKIVKVSLQLLQDSAFDLDTWLPRKLGERIGRRENTAFTVGTGSDEPEGVVANATVGKTGASGQVTSVTYDDIIDLEHSVDVAYRNQRSRFMFHDLTLAALRKVKDGNGQYLWQPSIQNGVPDSFNGRPYTINNDMPVQAASAKSILFGDFELGYIIRDVRAVQMLRLTERYADYLQVGFLGFTRHDGKPDDSGAIRAYTNAGS
jgi:HK97 family phage major capsid protein